MLNLFLHVHIMLYHATVRFFAYAVIVSQFRSHLSIRFPLQIHSKTAIFGLCHMLLEYWPTLLVESTGQGWVRMLLGC